MDRTEILRVCDEENVRFLRRRRYPRRQKIMLNHGDPSAGIFQFEGFIPRYMERHREKAGVTGWAQIHGLRGDTSVFERTKYDLWYIENWSLTLDLKIITRTAMKFLFDRTAY